MPSAPDISRVELARPSLAWLPSYLEFIEEMRALGETIWPTRVPLADDTPGDFVARLLAKEQSAELPFVTESVYWGVVDGAVVGLIALRHRLTEKLAQYGGHLGYEVCPSARRLGVATAMIKLVLATPHARAIGKLLITCAPSNTGSRKAIENAGGVLAGIVFVDEVKRDTCHYFVDAR
jgi:predicted acetyltransferase